MQLFLFKIIFYDFYFSFFYFLSPPPHETGGLYKRPSAILDTERRRFEDDMDKVLDADQRL